MSTTNWSMEDVNVANLLGTEEAKAGVEKFRTAMEANPVLNKVLEAAKSIEDMYQVAKCYLDIKLEDFKILMNKTADYFKSPKIKLEDDMMECVVGGWDIGGFWNKYKKVIISAAIIAGVAAITGGLGAAVGPALVVGLVDATTAVVSGAACTGIGIAVGGTVFGATGACIAASIIEDGVPKTRGNLMPSI